MRPAARWNRRAARCRSRRSPSAKPANSGKTAARFRSDHAKGRTMTKLSVNVNKIATLRNTRPLGIPDLVKLSALILDSGAHGITVHPRPDQRHIRADDVAPLAELVRRYPGAEYNIEGNPFHGLVEHCENVRP